MASAKQHTYILSEPPQFVMICCHTGSISMELSSAHCRARINYRRCHGVLT